MKTMSLAAILILVGCTSNITFNEVVERWGCGNYYDGCFSNCPIWLSADRDLGTGKIKFDEIVEHTSFDVDGLELRWNWCLEDDGYYRCTFTIDVEGTGRYYKFLRDEDTAKPFDLYRCLKIK